MIYKIYPVIKNKGVNLQSSIIGPLFSNLILNGIKGAAYTGFPKVYKHSFIDKEFIYQDFIFFRENLIFIFNEGQTSILLKNITKFLQSRGLVISDRRFQVFKFETNRFKFNFLGFQFMYIPKNSLILNTLIRKYDFLKIKKIYNQLGYILITISKESLD